jgi:hypothetical protein
VSSPFRPLRRAASPTSTAARRGALEHNLGPHRVLEAVADERAFVVEVLGKEQHRPCFRLARNLPTVPGEKSGGTAVEHGDVVKVELDRDVPSRVWTKLRRSTGKRNTR